MEDEETSNKQSVSSETQDRVFVADLKTRVHDTCAPLRDILHLAEYQGEKARQKPHTCGTHGKLLNNVNFEQHQKQSRR